jgi:hypothetical protein
MIKISICCSVALKVLLNSYFVSYSLMNSRQCIIHTLKLRVAFLFYSQEMRQSKRNLRLGVLIQILIMFPLCDYRHSRVDINKNMF